jgi:MFS family permease
MPLYSLSLAMVNDQLTPGEMVQAASALIVFYGVGSALGPYTASLAMSRLGPRGLFGFIGVILASYTLFDLVRLQIAPRLQARHREGYRAYPRTTFAAFSLLKRAGRRAQRQEPPADEKDEVNTPGA